MLLRMRGIIAIAMLIGGITSLVVGVARLAGTSEDSGVGLIVIGTILTILGVWTIRTMATGDTDLAVPQARSLGDHSLTDHHTRVPSEQPGGASEQPPSEPRAAIGGRRGIVIFAILSLVGVIGGVIALLESEPPNVAGHILAACTEALRTTEGPGASIGSVVDYESFGTDLHEITYETSQGWTWTCFYDTEAGQATASPIIRPGAVDRQ